MKINIKKKIGNLNVSIDTNEDFIGILGASGAGKSMLLKCISGIESPDAGEIVLGGRILYSSDKGINLPSKERKVGYLFQNYALFNHLTVRQNLLIVDKSCDILKYAKLCKIEDFLDKKPQKLSGGQKQRVALARILVSDADVVLLDEPFSALDLGLKSEIEEEIFKLLRKEKKKCILVSHNRDEIYKNTDTFGVLHDGKIIDFGSHVFEEPKTDISAKMVGFDNQFFIDKEKFHFKSKDAKINKNGKNEGIVIKITKNIDGNTVLVSANSQKVAINSQESYKVGENVFFDIEKVLNISKNMFDK